MRRRDFLRSAGLLSGALLSRRAHALAAVTPDSLATSSKPSIDPAQLRQQVTLAIGGDTTPGYNLQNHFDEQAAAGISRDQLEKNFNFKARPELVEVLMSGSVDVVSIANNHMSDFGPPGVMETIATLDAAGIGHFGAGKNLAAARAPWIVERNGLKLGFLGYYFQEGRDMIEPREVYATESARASPVPTRSCRRSGRWFAKTSPG